jgi:hypothetical protein
MDRVILLHFGGSVTEQFELVGMRCQVLTFQNRPSFNDLVAMDVIYVCTGGMTWVAIDRFM